MTSATTLTTSARYPGLDGLRAIAVLLVFYGHVPGLPYLVPGPLGVEMFFFLSGFLITTLLRVEAQKTGRTDLVAFYLRRTLRIMPPMYVALALTLGVASVGLIRDAHTTLGLFSHILFFTNYYIALAGDHGIVATMGPLWSLAVEEHFYLIFPALYLLLRRRLRSDRERGMALLVLCVVPLVWRAALVFVIKPPDLYAFLATDARFDLLLYGCALALLANPTLGEWPDRLNVRWLWLPALGLFLLTGRYGQAAALGVVRNTLHGLLLIPIFAAVLLHSDRRPLAVLNHPAVTWLGRVSYSFYLIHQLAITLLHEQWQGASPVLVGVVALLLALTLSQVMHVTVERPAMRLRRRIERSRTEPV